MTTVPTCCHFSSQNSGGGTAWRPEDTAKPTPANPNGTELYRPDILDHIEATIKELDGELRELSLDIHSMWHIPKLYDLVYISEGLQTIQNFVLRNSMSGFMTCADYPYRYHSHAHDVLTAFLSKHGFEVTKHFHLETAWRAAFSHGKGGRTIGVNSEVNILRPSRAFMSFWILDGRIASRRTCMRS